MIQIFIIKRHFQTVQSAFENAFLKENSYMIPIFLQKVGCKLRNILRLSFHLFH